MTATATAEAPVSSERGRRTLLIALVAVVLLAGGGGAFLLLGGEAEAGGEASVEDGEVVPVAEMTATLAGPQVHYAKLSFSAVLSVEADSAQVTARLPLLRDKAITELSTISADHLRTTAGMDELRARLSARASELYPGGEVLRIVLTELVVQ